MRILVHSNSPHLNSGYGNQCALLLPRLASLGHEVAVSAFAGVQGATISWNGFTVYPGGLDAYGSDVLPHHAARFGADLVLTLMDAWILPAEMMAGLNAACWMPVDCTPLSAMDRGFIRESGITPVAMSEHGRYELADAGFEALYAPHGVDTQAFFPQDKAAAREAMGVPQDAFVIGINAANLDAVRKGFPEQMAAFAMFLRSHPDALLLLHTHRTGPGSGCDLGDLAARLDIGKSVRWSDPYLYTCGGYSQEEMARWYACLDLYSGCSYGEGFGLPLLEAAACGIPSVTTAFSAMPQAAGPHAFLVSGQPFWNARHRSWWCKPDVAEIAGAYGSAVKAEHDRDAIREHALAYDADKVFAEHWVPALAVLEEGIRRAGRIHGSLAEAEDYMWDGADGDLAFDVGANEGQSVERMLPLFGRVIALEPAAESFARLAARWGDDPRAECLNVAAGDHAGTMALAVRDVPMQSGQLTAESTEEFCSDWGPAEAMRTVDCVTLDGLAETFGDPDFVKIDTEGSEAAVLAGATGLLARRRPRMLIEFHSAALRDQCEAILRGAGYAVETVRAPHVQRGSHFWLGYGWLVARPDPAGAA